MQLIKHEIKMVLHNPFEEWLALDDRVWSIIKKKFAAAMLGIELQTNTWALFLEMRNVVTL
jgi:hypothetical protein